MYLESETHGRNLIRKKSTNRGERFSGSFKPIPAEGNVSRKLVDLPLVSETVGLVGITWHTKHG